MNHDTFVAAYARGELKVDVDPAGAARLISAHLLLPLVMMPVLGAGIALALIGWIFTGLAVIAAGIIVPRMIKHSAPLFIFQQALKDPRAYDEAMQAKVLRITPMKPGEK